MKLLVYSIWTVLTVVYSVVLISSGLQIRPTPCQNLSGQQGTCMFVWDCIKTEGTHLGTCADGFLIGSCCAHNPLSNTLIPSTDRPLANDSNTFVSAVVHLAKPTEPNPTLPTSPPKPVTFRPPEYDDLKKNVTAERPGQITTSAGFPTRRTPVPNRPTQRNTTPYKQKTTTAIPRTTNNGSTEKYEPTSNSWLHPTRQPPYSSSQQSSTTSSTTKYPYVKPSWRPRPPSGGIFTSSRPYASTFSNYYTTPASTTQKPTQKPPQSTKWSTMRPLTISSIEILQTPNVTKPTSKPPAEVEKSTLKPRPSTETNSKRPTYRPSTVSKPTVDSFQLVTKPSVISLNLNKTTTENVEKSTVKPNMTWIPFLTTPRPSIHPVTSMTQFSWYPPKPSKKPPIAWFNNTALIESVLSTKPPTKAPVTIGGSIIVNNSSTSIKNTTGLGPIKPNSPITPCGIPNPHPQKKVVGGKNSAFGSWPWQVSVRRTSFFGFSSTHRCGGALISRQWVATAGHCVDDLILSQIKIRVGEYDFASVQEPHGYVERGAKKKVVHPRYNFFTYENDLALVQLEEPIDSDAYPHISPICLPPTEESLVGRNATVTGWGRLSEGGVLPSILQEVQVPIISNEKCKNMFLAAGRHEYIPEIFMCAGFEEGGRDSCQGDSGGPLQIQTEDGYWFLAGIISWGIGCAEPNMPGVCTRISKFKDWIVQQVV